MAFSPTNPAPPNCHSAVLLKERKTGTWRTAVVRLVCPAQQKGGLYRCVRVVDICSKNRKGGTIFKVAGR